MDHVILFLLNTSDYVMRRRSLVNSGAWEVTVSQSNSWEYVFVYDEKESFNRINLYAD